MPRVSTVVPAYNMARYLPECLTSILSQSYSDQEVVVVDDGSTDETCAVVQAFSPSVRYYRQENRGVAEALNTGIELAVGEYVGLVAADDALCPGAMETRVQLLDLHPRVGMVHGGAYMVDTDGRTISTHGFLRKPEVLYQHSRKAVPSLLKGNSVICSSVMIRRSCFRQLGGFNQEFMPGEDWEMWLRIGAHHDLVYVARPLARRRIHDASLRANFTVESVEGSHSRILHHLFAENGLGGFQHLKSYAYAANYRTLAGLAAYLRQRSAFAHYLARAILQRPTLLLEERTYGIVYEGARLFVPGSVLRAGRRLKMLFPRMPARGQLSDKAGGRQ